MAHYNFKPKLWYVDTICFKKFIGAESREKEARALLPPGSSEPLNA